MKKSRSKYQSHLLLQNLPFLTCNIEVVTFLFFLTLQVLSSTVVIVRSSNIIETSSHVAVDAPNSKTWIISKDLCNDDFPYCKCSSFHNITIICSCNESTETTTNEVVYLKKSPDSNTHFQKPTSITIQKCSNITIGAGAFSTLGPVVNVIISDVRYVEIQQNAFDLETRSASSTINFKNVKIPIILSHTFKSTVEKIEFTNTEIGIVSADSFRARQFKNIKFNNSTIEILESQAFSENTELGNLFVENSKFHSIKSNAIASGTGSMAWVDSWIGKLDGWAMSGTIPNISFLRNTIGLVQTNGLTFKQWTWVTLINNTFNYVNVSGIDLTNHATSYNITEINGNHWRNVQSNFVVVGKRDQPLALVINNKFSHSCDCNKSFLSEVSLNGSSPWFLQKLINTSYCSTTKKGATCLGQGDDIFVSYEHWKEFCSTTTFLCMNEPSEVLDVSYAPTFTSSKLRILVIFIGAVAIVIVACLIGVLCFYICRSREPRISKLNGCTTNKSNNCSPPHSYVDLMPSSKLSHVPTLRPTSMLIEDVEMQDKGVQTMPNELSTDVLEELRGKLAHSDSFWDAKDTIDHFYDLIQVKACNNTTLSSPPDVTMCNTGNSPTKADKILNQAEPVIETNQKPVPLPRYAQIKNKPKTAAICEYGDPSDSQMHVYSELNLAFPQTPTQKVNTEATETKRIRPVVCEYTEPKDVRPHVYAELGTSTNTPQLPYHQSLQRSPAQFQTQEHNFLSLNTASTQMRPLPSIPSSSSIVL